MSTGTEPHPTRGGVHTGTRAAIAAPHLRTDDRWWLAPAATAAGLLAFVVYSTWRALADTNYYSAPYGYLRRSTPPCLAERCRTDVRAGPDADLFGGWWGASVPAIIILIFPLGFPADLLLLPQGLYRGFWASPPACAVAEPHTKYTGETRFPLILQASTGTSSSRRDRRRRDPDLRHRALLPPTPRRLRWGHMGLGTLVFLLNITLIWAYTLSCHSCHQHIVGGKLKHFSNVPVAPDVAVGRKLERPPHAARLGVADQRGAHRLLRVPRRVRASDDTALLLLPVGP